MGKKIIVDPAKLKAASRAVDEDARTYESLYNQLFTEVTAMKDSWQGVDNLAYTNKIEQFKDDFIKMKNLMTAYSQYLQNAANKYEAAQEEIRSKANLL